MSDGTRPYETLRTGNHVLPAPERTGRWILVRPDAHLAWSGDAVGVQGALDRAGLHDPALLTRTTAVASPAGAL